MAELPVLDVRLVRAREFTTSAPVSFPDPAFLAFPERVVQFGTGALLRGLVDYIVDDANRRGFGGRIVAIGQTGSGRDDLVNAQDGLFTLLIEGSEQGREIREARVVGAVSRAISATADWDAVLALARNPDIEIIFSNTTEVGIAFDDQDRVDLAPPRSFPGKLTRYLYERAEAFDYDADKGVTVVPCELIEENGARLREIVLRLADKWTLGGRFTDWVTESVTFCDTLVDRIVSGTPGRDRSARIRSELGYRDELVTVCEPYHLLAIAAKDPGRARLEPLLSDGHVIATGDVSPYRERKVRILNGGHTAMVSLALLTGCETVLDAMTDGDIGPFIRQCVLDEIVPTVAVAGARDFANEVLERFSNPFIAHSLIDITLHGATKFRVRVVPSIIAHTQKRRQPPPALTLGFAAMLFFLRGDVQARRASAGLAVPPDEIGSRIQSAWQSRAASDFDNLAREVCGNVTLWGTDLTRLPGFVEAVGMHLSILAREGPRAALATLRYPVESLQGTGS